MSNGQKHELSSRHCFKALACFIARVIATETKCGCNSFQDGFQWANTRQLSIERQIYWSGTWGYCSFYKQGKSSGTLKHTQVVKRYKIKQSWFNKEKTVLSRFPVRIEKPLKKVTSFTLSLFYEHRKHEAIGFPRHLNLDKIELLLQLLFFLTTAYWRES